MEPDPEKQARTLFESGQELYERGEYAAAASAFREASRFLSRPELLYNLAQAERLSGECSAALRHYREFEASSAVHPPDLAAKIAEMERCELDVRRSVHENAMSSAPRPERPRDRTHASTGRREAPELRAFGWAAIGGAALSTLLGTILALRASEARQQLDEINRRGGQWSERYEFYENAMDRDRAIAAGLFVGAGVLAGTGAVVLLVPSVNGRADGVSARVSWRF